MARMQDGPAQQRYARALMGVVAASAFAYPLLLCAVKVAFAQLRDADVVAVVLWLVVGFLCIVGLVGALRWGSARRVRSPWLLAGLLPPALYELWLFWPQLTV